MACDFCLYLCLCLCLCLCICLGLDLGLGLDAGLGLGLGRCRCRFILFWVPCIRLSPRLLALPYLSIPYRGVDKLRSSRTVRYLHCPQTSPLQK
jgi:hypothetical protein